MIYWVRKRLSGQLKTLSFSRDVSKAPERLFLRVDPRQVMTGGIGMFITATLVGQNLGSEGAGWTSLWMAVTSWEKEDAEGISRRSFRPVFVSLTRSSLHLGMANLA